MILDKRQNIGQHGSRVACKILIGKPAPVAQGIERSPPKLTPRQQHVIERARELARRLSNKPPAFCAKRRRFVRPCAPILDSY
jgi:hypothetical protein